jgi:hypothetical protein
MRGSQPVMMLHQMVQQLLTSPILDRFVSMLSQPAQVAALVS